MERKQEDTRITKRAPMASGQGSGNQNEQDQVHELDEQDADELAQGGLRGDALLRALDRRREAVRELWLRGYSLAAIARSEKCSVRTVKRDLIHVRHAMQLERLPTLADDLNRAVGVHRTVQSEAWLLFHKLDGHAHNKVAALDTIVKSELAIAKLLGTEAPEAVNSRVLADLQEVLTRTLEQTGGPELVRAFLEQLKLQHVRGAVARLLTRSGSGEMDIEPTTVEANPELTRPDQTPARTTTRTGRRRPGARRAMSQAYDDSIKRLTEMLESHAAPAPEPTETDASDSTSERGTSSTIPRLTDWPLPLEAVQAVQAASRSDGETGGEGDPPDDLQDWRARARAALRYAAPGALGSGTNRRWTAEQQRTIDTLRHMQADVPRDLELWRARMGLPSRHSTEEPWVEQARQTTAGAAVVVPSLPTPAPADVLLLPPPGTAAGSVEQASKQSEPAGQADESASSTAPEPVETE
jgi:hypothetical protein